MSTGMSKGMMNAVERHLDPEIGKTPKEIHGDLDLWSVTSVRHALRQLVDEGRASFTGNHCNRLYRKEQS